MRSRRESGLSATTQVKVLSPEIVQRLNEIYPLPPILIDPTVLDAQPDVEDHRHPCFLSRLLLFVRSNALMRVYHLVSYTIRQAAF